MPWALRDRGLLQSLRARDAGTVVPPAYSGCWTAGDGDRNAEAIAGFSVALAKRVSGIVNEGEFPLVVGGDCSILIGNALALKARGRFGLVFLDAHSDFRHPANAASIGAAAGEDLAIVTGRGDSRLININSLGAYFRPEDVVVIGVRATDEYLDEIAEVGINTILANDVKTFGVQAAVERATALATRHAEGFWVHLDFDVLDESEMPAVDCPEPDGISFAMLTELVRSFLESAGCIGMELTIYDPDLDPDGQCADKIAQFIVSAFTTARFVE